MTALEKLNALQAGELDKVLECTPYAPEAFKDYGHAAYFKRGEKSFNDCLPNAAKVEVTKVVLDEYLRTGDKTLLQQLKESL
jgi:hypothetical protein